MAYELQFPARIKKRIESGRIIEQKIWSFIRELNSFDEEHLDAPALIDGCREYTYRQMFRKWDEYAEVFSALNITGKNSSRAGLLPDYSSGAVFSLYALNMTGASVSVIHYMDLLDTERWDRMIEKEGITDLVLCDRHLTPELLARVAGTKERCGLRNIIVLHDAGTNRFEPRGAGARSGARYGKLKQVKGVLFMKDLLRQYEAYPVVQARKTSRNDAVILHTSGTTNGIHKPVPLSDRGFNESAARLLRSESLQSFEKPVATVLLLDMTASFSILDMLHHPFAFGGSVLIVPDGGLNPKMPFYIAENKITVLFAGSAFLDILSRLRVRIDLSNLEQVYVGGTYTSADVKKRCNAYLKKNGSKARISIGYGATETGSSCILAPPDRDDDAIGFPLPGVRVKIFNEAEEKYYDLEDGPGTGVLLISSPSVSSGAFNGTTFFELEEIDGEKYYNTYDLVTVHEDGSMSCVGRMNKFFVNNEGVRFDAGLVETAVGAEPKIVRCALAPVYEKYMHDTVPVLYVQTSEKGLRETEAVRNALCNVFIRDNKIAETNIPGQCVITDQIPLNEAGKVDVTRILKGEGQGQKYSIRQVKRGGRVVGLRLKPAIEGIDAFDNVPDELRYEGNLAKKYFEESAREQTDGQPAQEQSAPGPFGNGQCFPGQFFPGQFFPGRFFPGQFPPCMMMPGPPGNGQCAPGQSAPRRPAPGQGFPAGGFPLPFFRMPPFPAAPRNQFPCQGEQGGSGGQQMPCTGSRPQTRNSSEDGGEDVQPAVSILNDVLGTLFHASKYDRYYEE